MNIFLIPATYVKLGTRINVVSYFYRARDGEVCGSWAPHIQAICTACRKKQGHVVFTWEESACEVWADSDRPEKSRINQLLRPHCPPEEYSFVFARHNASQGLGTRLGPRTGDCHCACPTISEWRHTSPSKFLFAFRVAASDCGLTSFLEVSVALLHRLNYGGQKWPGILYSSHGIFRSYTSRLFTSSLYLKHNGFGCLSINVSKYA